MLSVVAVTVVAADAAVAAAEESERWGLGCLRMSVRDEKGESVVGRGDAAARWSWPRF